MVEFPDNMVEMINERLGGYDGAMGLKFIKATPDEFVSLFFMLAQFVHVAEHGDSSPFQLSQQVQGRNG